MPILDAFERGALFRLTRFVTLMIILAFCVPLGIAGVVYYHFFGVGSTVQYSEIDAEMHPSSDLYPKSDAPPDDTQTAQSATGPAVPDVLKPYFDTPEKQQELLSRLESLDAGERYDYVENLATVVNDAKSSGQVDVWQVIQQYFATKDRRIGRTPTDKAVLWGSRVGLVLFTMFTMVLVAIASLILVLLAIERNTRPLKPKKASAAPPPPMTSAV